MKMLDLAATESQIRVVRWLVEPGEPVLRGQPLVEVETDKATMEVESIVSGILTEVHAQPDEEVDVGSPIAGIEVTDLGQQTPASTPPEAAKLETPPAEDAPRRAAPTSRPKDSRGMFARNRAKREPKGPSNE